MRLGTGPTDIAPESTNTYNSQSTFVLTIPGSSQTTYMFMGDAWDHDGTDQSNYLWLPLNVSTSAHTATLQDYAYWKVDPTTGTSIILMLLQYSDGAVHGCRHDVIDRKALRG